ncbi:Chromo domain-containing protein [Forsythia ovata]|uniref:Chromo domain-containing protein n=1 Tax=Forsythia ovata TaxID=205694 RepID=A0ABD1TN17_9LAMI
MRKRKRKSGITHTQTKKKHQKGSPVAATYNVPSHRVRITKDPIPVPQINDSAAANDNGKTHVSDVNGVETSKKVNENGLKMILEGRNEQSELDLKLCELKGAMITSEDNVDRLAVPSQEGQVTTGDAFSNGLQMAYVVDPALSSQCIGAKKRKSGSVKRFKKDPVSYTMDDAQNVIATCTMAEPRGVQSPEFLGNNTNCKSQLEDSRKLGTTIARIIKPISYQISISNNVEEVLVAFDAVRLDGTKVTVDNKFLKANNPLLPLQSLSRHHTSATPPLIPKFPTKHRFSSHLSHRLPTTYHPTIRDCTFSTPLPFAPNTTTTREKDLTTQTLLKEELRKVRILLQQNRTETAKRHVKNLISVHPVSQIYSLYSQPSPSSSTKPIFTDTILSVYADSKLPNEAAQIYNLIREDGNFPLLSAFKQFLKSLVSSSQFDKTLEIFAEVVDSGTWVDRFSYRKAIQSVMKLGDLKRGLELMNHMNKCGLNSNGFVYNVLIGGLCKQIVVWCGMVWCGGLKKMILF